MCCSTGLCGTEVDPTLVQFASLLGQLSHSGVRVERYNLGQQPMAFVQNTAVKALLDSEGMDVLPLIFVDGVLNLKGRYWDDSERQSMTQSVRAAASGVTA
jgi:hypothetical protein